MVSFNVADQGIDIDQVVGETIEVPVTIGDGPLVYICKFHRSCGMAGSDGDWGMRQLVLRVSCP